MDEGKWIKERRRVLGFTQHQLAALAGVSQSLVAKIEAGRVDAAYSKVRAIMEALERQQAEKEKKAEDIMHVQVKSVSPDDSLHSAALLMRKLSISQMPVMEKGLIVGSISEQAILAHISDGKKKMESMKVREIMEEAFPTALASTPISAVAALLRHYPAVLVTKKGGIAGIITKADLLKTI